MIIYGVHPIAELLDRVTAGRLELPRAAMLLVARDNAHVRRVRRQAAALEIPVRAVTAADLERRCGSSAHRGVALVGASASTLQAPAGRRLDRNAADSGARTSAGRGRSGKPASLRRRLAELAQQPMALIVVVDGVTDPANLGSITRSAEQFGADLLVAPRRRTAHFDDTVMRVSAGAAAHVATVAVANVASALEESKRSGFWIYGADLGGETLDEVRFPERVALVPGSEGAGLHDLVRRRCDHLVRIPTTGRLNSLNVGVAAGILMYEVRRQWREETRIPRPRSRHCLKEPR